MRLCDDELPHRKNIIIINSHIRCINLLPLLSHTSKLPLLSSLTKFFTNNLVLPVIHSLCGKPIEVRFSLERAVSALPSAVPKAGLERAGPIFTTIPTFGTAVRTHRLERCGIISIHWPRVGCTNEELSGRPRWRRLSPTGATQRSQKHHRRLLLLLPLLRLLHGPFTPPWGGRPHPFFFLVGGPQR
jgi:hypothetical protein